MKVDAFDFALPDSCIAIRPASPRDAARMLVVEDGAWQDRIVRELPEFLRPGDILVCNDTRVIPARLFGTRGEARVEFLLHRAQGADTWRAFAKPAKRLKAGDTVMFAAGFSASVLEKLPSGEVVLRFNVAGATMRAMLDGYGEIPLPPYIQSQRTADARDRADYQTMYAAHEGSVAAPTAGLHFTPALMAALDARGVARALVTLHVGAGTFQPVKAEDTEAHVMHAERASVSAETAARINAAKAAGGRVVAVGTTSLRTLESAADAHGALQAFEGETDIFITPGYRFRAVDVLLTNFHLPKSTLFMLVSAFCGLETMQAAYAHAVAQHYRFYSYGDACLLHRKDGVPC
jgi:S-adenosylmethionine:tRNA ribosyltransferase-isomerase